MKTALKAQQRRPQRFPERGESRGQFDLDASKVATQAHSAAVDEGSGQRHDLLIIVSQLVEGLYQVQQRAFDLCLHDVYPPFVSAVSLLQGV